MVMPALTKVPMFFVNLFDFEKYYTKWNYNVVLCEDSMTTKIIEMCINTIWLQQTARKRDI